MKSIHTHILNLDDISHQAGFWFMSCDMFQHWLMYMPWYESWVVCCLWWFYVVGCVNKEISPTVMWSDVHVWWNEDTSDCIVMKTSTDTPAGTAMHRHYSTYSMTDNRNAVWDYSFVFKLILGLSSVLVHYKWRFVYLQIHSIMHSVGNNTNIMLQKT